MLETRDMDLIERARRYVGKMEGSVSGAGGHAACFSAACALVKGFGLTEGEALSLMREEFNPKCAPAWSEKELLHKVRQAGKSNGEVGYLLKGQDVAAMARGRVESGRSAKAAEPVKKGQEMDEAAVRRMQVRGVVIDEDWLMERSPIDVREIDRPELFLGHVLMPGEKVLVFTREYSQGDFGFLAEGGDKWPGRSFRLGDRPGVRPETAELPKAGREGVWWLCQPVSAEWLPTGAVDPKTGEAVVSRRSAGTVTSWRFLLLESDEVGEREWLNVLVQLPLPVVALYTSGDRSVHALLRMEARTQDESRKMSDKLAPVLAKMGGDWKAMTSVRLTRLPLCMREGKMEKTADGRKRYVRYEQPRLQRLLWLDPAAGVEPILTKPKLRDLEQ